ncbi:MAG TPA: MurR/RpiR family transcriptional regulator [Terriglobales bacterium]|jgi:DNA-binding MurR/RpiR family transcriptional regulator|nr:MurR/RpiR family transcriptional regulator [Terriglobales bacterium]
MISRPRQGVSPHVKGGGSEDRLRPWSTDLEHRVAAASEKLNPRRRRLVQAILENPEDTYFLSSRELARRFGVDAATIVRTIQVLGYEQFSDFSADLRSYFVTRITPYKVMKAATRGKRSLEDHVEQSLQMESQNLLALDSSLAPAQIVELARRIDRAHRVVVVGVDLAYSLSWFLAYGLSWLGYTAEAPVGSSGNLQHRVRLLSKQDLLIAISFGRCLRDTVDAVQTANSLGAPTFGITDNGGSPIARFCDDHWVVSVTNPTFNGSYVAPMAAMDAILVACAHIRPKRSLELLRRKDEEDIATQRWFTPNSPAG